MKTRTINYFKTLLFALPMVIVLSSCERELSDAAEFATLSTTGEIFTDTFVGLGADFYFPFVGDGAKPDVFSVDTNEGYESAASIRIDVPNSNDPTGNFAGAIFLVDGAGRNLTGFDALTFWARASEGAPMTVGFGESTYQVSTDITVGTGWAKYIIPIPDPSKLTDERGMLFFSAGSQHNGGFAYTFWLDEIKFENTGTIAQVRPNILNGEDVVQESFTNVTLNLSGLTTTFSTGSGFDQTLNVAPAYYDFTTTDASVASVNGSGEVSILSEGSATITAELAGVQAAGSLEITSLGDFESAPAPTRDASSVISILSDSYTNAPVDYYNGFFEFQTTLGGVLNVGGDNLINYTDLNFVGIGTFVDVPTIDATGMTGLHMDINVQEAIDPGDFIIIRLLNDVGGNEISGDFFIDGAQLLSQGWAGFDMPLDSFGLADRSKLGLLFFVSDATISNIFVDNIYYYQE